MWTTTKRCLLRCIATLCVATVFLVRAEDADASIGTQLAKLTAKDGTWNDYFGYSVAVSDGIAVVGAYLDDDAGDNSGSAYVFEMSDSSDETSWTQVAKLTAADAFTGDYFGRSIAISDGTIVVGAYRDSDKGSNSGSAYVFEKSDSSDETSWTQVAKLTADDGAASDYFGVAVAISDGTIVVGAHQDDDKGSGSGSAYVFEKSDSSDATSWTQVAKLTAADGAASDYFGRSIAISDGTIVVGAYLDDDKGSGSGSAYVFEKSDSSDETSWTQVAKLTADDGAVSDRFGYSVAISDGIAVVGAYYDISYRGSAYIFEVKLPSPPPPPPPPPSPYEEYPIKLLKTIYANGTITEEVVESSSAAARLGAALMPSSSSDALPLLAAVAACVALLAVVATTRRARKTSVNGEEADALLNANTYGALHNA